MMMTNEPDVTIVSGSDFHIGNSKISAQETHLNLKDFFFPEVIKSNIVFLGGDFFDRLLKLDEPAAIESIAIITELINLAAEHNIKIRVLRGTFSHDRHQNAVFESIQSKTNANVDLKCFSTISVELIKDYNLRVLYIPDNLPYKDKEEVFTVINDLLQAYGWDYIDVVVGHGYFEHVFPVNVTHPPIIFDYEDFKNLVHGYILMGHVHTTSVYKNIIYNGSFERFAHGEEEKKGFYTVNRINGIWGHKFVENLDTPLFYTIKLKQLTVDEALIATEEFIKNNYPDNKGFLRLSHTSDDIKQQLITIIREKYPNIVVTAKTNKDNIANVHIIKQFKSCTCVIPTEKNLASLIIDFIKDTKNGTTLTEELINKELGIQ